MHKFAICGEAGSGKDLLFTMIKAVMATEYSGKIYSLENIINNEKNTDWLTFESKIKPIRFAGPIKACISAFTGISIEDLNLQEVKLKELSSTWFTKDKSTLTIRDLHTILADAIKNAFHDDIFALSLSELTENITDQNICVIDLRYPNENAILDSSDFIVFKILRNNSIGSKSSHSSETEVSNIQTPYLLHNNSSREELFIKIIELLFELNWITLETFNKYLNIIN